MRDRSAWLGRLTSGNIAREKIIEALYAISENDWALLDILMGRILSECSSLDVMPAKGYAPFGFHVQVPNVPPPFVYAAIVPRPKSGILVLTRRRLIGFNRHPDKQLPWKKIITNDEDVDQILRYCKGLQ